MLDHVGIQRADMSASSAFHDAVLEPLGASRLMDFGVAIGYGVQPEPDYFDVRAPAGTAIADIGTTS